jgi:hypothetical protein
MVLPQLVNIGFQVLFHSPHGVLFTVPSQYYALSVTEEYLALRGGPRAFPQDFSCLVVLWILQAGLRFRVRGYHSLRRAFPKPFPYLCPIPFAVLTPDCSQSGLGSSAFARRYLRNRCFFLFLRLLRCFSSPGSLPCVMNSRMDDRGLLCRVAPFGDLRFEGYLHLPAAFRSLLRPSSALSAKASTLRSLFVDRLPLSTCVFSSRLRDTGSSVFPAGRLDRFRSGVLRLTPVSEIFLFRVVYIPSCNLATKHSLGCLFIVFDISLCGFQGASHTRCDLFI